MATTYNEDDAGDYPEVKESAYVPPAYKPISLKFADEDEVEDANEPFVTSLPSRKAWVGSLCRRIEWGVNERRAGGFDDKVRKNRDQYESKAVEKTQPWVGCASLRRPTTRSHVDTIHAHLEAAIFGVQPYFKTEPNNSDNTPVAELQEQALDSIFRGQIPLADIGALALKAMLIDSTAILMPHWEVKIGKKRSWERITPELLALTEGASQDTTNPSLAAAAKSLLKQIKAVPIGTYATIEREEVIYDGPRVDLVDILDFGTYPVDIRNLDGAQVQWRRRWLTCDQLLHGAKSGEFDPDEVRRLTGKAPIGVGPMNDMVGGDQTRFQAQGLPGVDNTISEWDKPYECFQGLCRCDADGDGLPEWVLFTVAPNERCLLRAEVYPYFHDRPFFVPLIAYRNPTVLYGYSLCDILADLQDELDAIGNQRLDNGTLLNTPTFEMLRDVQWNVQANRFQPGAVFKVSQLNSVKRIDLGSVDQKAFAEDAGVRRDMMEVSGINQTLLAQTAKGSAPLGETELAQQGSNAKFDVLVNAVGIGFSEVAMQVARLMGQYMPDTMEFNAGTSKVPAFKSISRDQMQESVPFKIYGTAELANHAIQAQLAEKVQMLAERLPWVQEDLTKVYNVAAWVLERFGVKDYQRFIGTPEEAAAMQQAKQDAPPPPPEMKVSRSERTDEVLTLALVLKEGGITEQEYLAAAALAAKAAGQLPIQDFKGNVPDANPTAPGVAPPLMNGAAPHPPIGVS